MKWGRMRPISALNPQPGGWRDRDYTIKGSGIDQIEVSSDFNGSVINMQLNNRGSLQMLHQMQMQSSHLPQAATPSFPSAADLDLAVELVEKIETLTEENATLLEEKQAALSKVSAQAETILDYEGEVEALTEELGNAKQNTAAEKSIASAAMGARNRAERDVKEAKAVSEALLDVLEEAPEPVFQELMRRVPAKEMNDIIALMRERRERMKAERQQASSRIARGGWINPKKDPYGEQWHATYDPIITVDPGARPTIQQDAIIQSLIKKGDNILGGKTP